MTSLVDWNNNGIMHKSQFGNYHHRSWGVGGAPVWCYSISRFTLPDILFDIHFFLFAIFEVVLLLLKILLASIPSSFISPAFHSPRVFENFTVKISVTSDSSCIFMASLVIPGVQSKLLAGLTALQDTFNWIFKSIWRSFSSFPTKEFVDFPRTFYFSIFKEFVLAFCTF